MIKNILVVLMLVVPSAVFAEELEWSKLSEPTKHKPQIYGTYSAGCMDGGKRVPDKGEGYFLGGVHDGRYYGQPEMLTFLTKLGKNFYNELGRTLIVGDISSPRGGPVPIDSSLHQSHQTGLDIDIWFESAKPGENPKHVKQRNMLDGKYNRVNKHWGADKVAVLRDAAMMPDVDRIFVNYIIKNELCRHYVSEPWMRKVRPWWGHAAHFHVRLKCPKGSPECVNQAPLSEESGCGEDLEWWFSDEAQAGSGAKEPRKYPVLPKQCNAVYNFDK